MSLDGTWAELATTAAPPLPPTSRLMALLGAEGARWDDFVGLAPNRDLPWFADEDPAAEGGSLSGAPGLARFRRAHHAAGFYGLVADRLVDGQAAAEPALEGLAAQLLGQWRRQLGEAVGDEGAAWAQIRRTRRRAARATRREQHALATRHLDLDDYGTTVAMKLDWIGTAGEALLGRAGERARARRFRALHTLLLLGLQLVDDAVDEAEDRGRFGCSVPEALGLPPGGFFRAAVRLGRVGADLARRASFRRLGGWLEERSDELALHTSGRGIRDEWAGVILAAGLESTWRAKVGRCGLLSTSW